MSGQSPYEINLDRINKEQILEMVTFVCRLSSGFYFDSVNNTGIGAADAVSWARNIFSDLPRIPDTDAIQAKIIAASFSASGKSFEGPILAAIKIGRKLQKEESGQ